MSFHNSYRSPETKHEVTQAARILTGLGIIFAVITLVGVGMAWAFQDAQHLVIALPCAFTALLTFAAGAYNRYYTRTMTHAPIMAAAFGIR